MEKSPKNKKNTAYGHARSYAIPLRFLLENRDNITLLYLYCRLRQLTIDKAGYIKPGMMSGFTHRDKYVKIPKMRKLGWIDQDNKLISTSKIVHYNHPYDQANYITVKLNYKYLKSLKSFKEYIFSTVEAYILKGKYKSETKGYLVQNRDYTVDRKRINRGNDSPNATKRITDITQKGEFVFSAKKSNDDLLCSQISVSMLKKWGYSQRSISRLRKGNINHYRTSFQKFEIPPHDIGCFYAKSIKSWIRKNPTQVIVPYKSVYYFSTDSRIHRNSYLLNNNTGILPEKFISLEINKSISPICNHNNVVSPPISPVSREDFPIPSI